MSALTVLMFVRAAVHAAGPAKPATEAEMIEALIKAVEELKDAKFVRNGSEYDAKDAAAHLRRKWDAGKDQIKTARDFIRAAGTKSSVSGKPYLIRFKDGKEVPSETFLSGKLDEIEKGAGERAGAEGEWALARGWRDSSITAAGPNRLVGRAAPGRAVLVPTPGRIAGRHDLHGGPVRHRSPPPV
jgi:hypothetical protein